MCTHTHTSCFGKYDKWHSSNLIIEKYRISETKVCERKINQEKSYTKD